mgnify:CR=1 FL=1
MAIRFIVYPNIDRYKDDVAQYVSKNLGLTVNIGEIITGWDGVSPHIALKKIDVLDAENRVAFKSCRGQCFMVEHTDVATKAF